MTTRRLAFAAAFLVLIVSVVIAFLAVSTGPPSCQVGSVAASDHGVIYCERYVNPSAGPSFREHVEATRDRKIAERLLIVGVGLLGAILLVGVALRMSAARAPADA